MAGESVAYFAAKAVLDNKQFISASRETSSRARQMARDFKELDRQAKADAGSAKRRDPVGDAISWGKAIYAINAAEKAMRAFNDASEESGTMVQRLQRLIEGLPIVGGLSREGRRFGEKLWGNQDSDMRAELDRLRRANQSKEDSLRQRRESRERASDQVEKERLSRAKRYREETQSVNDILAEQRQKTDAVLYTESERVAAADRAVMLAAEQAGATQSELWMLRDMLKLQHEREAVAKRIEDTDANMAAVGRELQEAEAKRRDDYAYMLDVQKEITAEKKKQLDRERELAEAGKRSVAAMEAGSTAAYSAAVRAGARTGLGGRGVESALRQIAMSSSRTARNTFANRVTTVDSF